ncbi:MAG: YcxB family protein [Gammaproteobacteria bacterium]|nr:YcxB family protein [Gammaproteobacteria bacterium]
MSSTYGYTLQPIPYELTTTEQQEAQFDLWKKSNKVSTKVWAILAAICVAAIAGIVFLHGYSTAFFWVLLVGVALFLVVRFFGLAWYVKREILKYPTQDIKGIKIGVQPQGLIMIQKMGMQEGRATIDWKQVTEWQETEKFLFITAQVKGQTSSQIIPKRMVAQKFPFETVRKHLTDAVGPAK